MRPWSPTPLDRRADTYSKTMGQIAISGFAQIHVPKPVEGWDFEVLRKPVDLRMRRGDGHRMTDEEFTAKDRFLRLPDDPSDHDRVLRIVRHADPDARIHMLSPPIGPVIEVHNFPAWMAARMVGCTPNSFASPRL